MAKLKPSWRFVLTALGKADDYIPARLLPDGFGRIGNGRCASGTNLKEMKEAGVIQYGKSLMRAHHGYRITPAGLRALEEER
ncbi:hypothetical protein ABLE91_05510 [Aquabacter sp. CN5-332]|uniref:hypothetical protein n=1 Tax=Aquabacter sp. CN5-332 TaxID=3156608 RepID=UPI0032B50F29